MSTKSTSVRAKGRQGSTDKKWFPVTSKFGQWEHQMTDRHDLAVGVVKNTGGAPARYNPMSAEIELNEGMVEHLTPAQVGAPDFIYKHASLAGAMVHEGAHARFSGMDLEKLFRAHGGEWLECFAMLEESRCERQQWGNLKPHEKAALRACALEIVLRDTNPDETDTGAAALMLVGLMAGRIGVTIDLKLDVTLSKVWAKVKAILGTNFTEFNKLAVEFSKLKWEPGYWGVSNNDTMLKKADVIVSRWLELAAEMKGDDAGEGDGDGEPSESEDGESGKDKADGEGDGEGEGEGEGPGEQGDKPGEGESDGGASGKPKPKSGKAGKTPEQSEAGDDVTKIKEGSGDNGRGAYGSGHYETVDADEDELIEMAKALREAAGVVMEKIRDGEISVQVKALAKANAEAQATRRQNNKDAKARWKK